VTLLGKTFFDSLDFLTTNLMMPLGGLATVLFTGWILSRKTVQESLGIDQPQLFNLWWQLLRFITPVAILVVFLHSLGVF